MHENRNDQFCCAAQKKNIIVKFLIDIEFIIFFIQNEAQTHLAQKVLVDDFISGRLISAVRCSDICRPRTGLQQRVSLRMSATAQSRLARVRCGASKSQQKKCLLSKTRNLLHREHVGQLALLLVSPKDARWHYQWFH